MINKKLALITGGSSGLGKSMAMAMASNGYVPLLVARNKHRLAQTVAEMKQAGYSCFSYQGDVTNTNDMLTIKADVASRFGALDFMVLNAGVVTPGALKDFPDPTILKKDLDINLWGSILTAHSFSPLLTRGAP